MRRTAGCLLAATLCVTSLSGCGILPTEEEFDAAPIVKEYEGNNYNKYTVKKGDMVQKESLICKYQGTTTTEITGGDAGEQIDKFLVKKGDKIKSEAKIAKYYVADEEAALKAAQREIKRLSLQVSQARQLRAAELKKLKRTGGNKEQRKNVNEQYGSEITGYESSLKLAKINLQEAKENMADNILTSEVGGTIIKLNKSLEGGYPSEDDVIAVVRGKKRNRFKITTDYVKRFKNGQEVVVTVAGQQYKTRVKKTNSKKYMYLVPKNTVALDNGVTGFVDLILQEKKNVLFVPAALVFDMGSKKVVYVEGDGGVKTIREVTVGEQIGSSIEVLSGLKEDEQIIAN